MDAKQAADLYLEYLRETSDHGYHPIISLDFSSLYPSLIMTYNLSPEYTISSESEADRLRSKYPIHDISFTYNYEDYRGESQSRQVRGWTVRHEGDIRFGLYPRILLNLFNQRSQVKKELEKLKKLKEHLTVKYANTGKHPSEDPEYNTCMYRINYVDTKQKALKVFMNTFYGELGNKTSPLFILELAGGITSAGQRNLKLVKKYIESRQCRVYYGDTDSLYFGMSPRLFRDIDRRYLIDGNLSRIDYSRNLVEKTFEEIKELNTSVNNTLRLDNGTGFLKMAYEEVLYPTAFLARKKYYGIAHEGVFVPNPTEMFIRGFEVKKRGVSEILRILCMSAMWESMSFTNSLTLRDIVLKKVESLFSSTWNLEDFKATAMFKPDKQNIPVIMFANRMEEEGKPKVIPFERFEYVLCKITDPSRLFDYKGRKIEIKKGHMMEYLSVAKEQGLSVDIRYYFENQLVGQFARLLSYDPEFVVDTMGDELDASIIEDTDVDDDATMKRARKYILSVASKYNYAVDYSNTYKTLYRSLVSGMNDHLKSVTKKHKSLPLGAIECNSLQDAIDRKVHALEEHLMKTEMSSVRTMHSAMCKKHGKQEMQKLLRSGKNSIHQKWLRQCDSDIASKKADFVKDIRSSNMETLFYTDETHMMKIADKYRKRFVDNLFTDNMPVDDIKTKIQDSMSEVLPDIQDDALCRFANHWRTIQAAVKTKVQHRLLHEVHFEKKDVVDVTKIPRLF